MLCTIKILFLIESYKKMIVILRSPPMSPISGTKKRPPGVPPGVPPTLTDEEKDDDDYEDDSSDEEIG